MPGRGVDSEPPHWDTDGPWEGVGALRALEVPMDAQAQIMGGNLARMPTTPCDTKVSTSDNALAPAV